MGFCSNPKVTKKANKIARGHLPVEDLRATIEDNRRDHECGQKLDRRMRDLFEDRCLAMNLRESSVLFLKFPTDIILKPESLDNPDPDEALLQCE